MNFSAFKRVLMVLCIGVGSVPLVQGMESRVTRRDVNVMLEQIGIVAGGVYLQSRFIYDADDNRARVEGNRAILGPHLPLYRLAKTIFYNACAWRAVAYKYKITPRRALVIFWTIAGLEKALPLLYQRVRALHDRVQAERKRRSVEKNAPILRDILTSTLGSVKGPLKIILEYATSPIKFCTPLPNNTIKKPDDIKQPAMYVFILPFVVDSRGDITVKIRYFTVTSATVFPKGVDGSVCFMKGHKLVLPSGGCCFRWENDDFDNKTEWMYFPKGINENWDSIEQGITTKSFDELFPTKRSIVLPDGRELTIEVDKLLSHDKNSYVRGMICDKTRYQIACALAQAAGVKIEDLVQDISGVREPEPLSAEERRKKEAAQRALDEAEAAAEGVLIPAGPLLEPGAFRAPMSSGGASSSPDAGEAVRRAAAEARESKEEAARR